MTDQPIFEQILQHGRQDIDGVRRVWDDIIHLHRHATPTTGEAAPAMSVITDPANAVQDFVSRFKAEADHVLADLMPAIHSGADDLDRVTASPIVAELSALVAPLDPEVERLVAGMIHASGVAAATIAQLTAPPPAPVEAPPAEAPVA